MLNSVSSCADDHLRGSSTASLPTDALTSIVLRAGSADADAASDDDRRASRDLRNTLRSPHRVASHHIVVAVAQLMSVSSIDAADGTCGSC